MGLKSSNNFSRTPVENNSSDDFSGLEIVRVCVNKINYRFNINLTLKVQSVIFTALIKYG